MANRCWAVSIVMIVTVCSKALCNVDCVPFLIAFRFCQRSVVLLDRLFPQWQDYKHFDWPVPHFCHTLRTAWFPGPVRSLFDEPAIMFVSPTPCLACRGLRTFGSNSLIRLSLAAAAVRSALFAVLTFSSYTSLLFLALKTARATDATVRAASAPGRFEPTQAEARSSLLASNDDASGWLPKPT